MIASRFSVSVHILSLLAQENGSEMSSEVMAESIGVNPVIVRTLLGKLREAGLVETKRGVRGATLVRPVDQITLLDVFEAVNLSAELFSIHERPNPNCSVGVRIQETLEHYFLAAEVALKGSLSEATMKDVTNDLARKSKGPKVRKKG